MKLLDKLLEKKDQLIAILGLLGPLFSPLKSFAQKIIDNPLLYSVALGLLAAVVLIVAIF